MVYLLLLRKTSKIDGYVKVESFTESLIFDDFEKQTQGFTRYLLQNVRFSIIFEKSKTYLMQNKFLIKIERYFISKKVVFEVKLSLLRRIGNF